jgi:hypothetical protein
VKDMIPLELIEKKIYLVRGQKVMLDRDLAELYGVETRELNQAVRRNSDRFPDDFMFALDRDEIARISQIVISSAGRPRQQKGGTSQYRDHADLREAEGDDGIPQGSGENT